MAEAVTIGPTDWPAAERTIYPYVADWCERWLTQPDGPEAGRGWKFTKQQAQILAWWFAFDEHDRWLYRRGTIRMCKGWGKDPIAAVLSALELCGPCRVRDGKAVPHPSPWVQIAAVSREQTRTTMRIFPTVFSKRAIARFELDVNKEVIYAHGGRGVIEAVTSSPLALEGGRATLTILNEVQNWQSSNSGHEMAEVIAGNLAKSRDGAARALSLCNAHVPGEDSVGEREWDVWQAVAAGRTRLKDVLYVAVEAPPDTKLADEVSLKAGLTLARGDATWLDVDRLAAEVWDPRTEPSVARRKYLNQVVAAEDAWVTHQEWDARKVEAQLEKGDEGTLGFDGSKTDDHTALIFTRISDGCMFTFGVWDPEQYGGEIPRDEVNAAVSAAFEDYDVVGFYSDLHPFESYVDRWRDEHGADLCVKAGDKHPIAWDMRGRQKETVKAAERFHDAIVEGALTHDGDRRLAEHVYNARRRVYQYGGVSFRKETPDSPRKVDALAAAVLSRLAYWDYQALPESKRRHRRTGKATFA